MKKRLFCIILLIALLFSAPTAMAEDYDYARADAWIYHAYGVKKDVDIFLVAPTVDLGTAGNMNLSADDRETNENLKGATNMIRELFAPCCRVFSPYYRQVALPVYALPEDARMPYIDIAYGDVLNAFRHYIDEDNDGRPFLLGGFSQGAQMCLKLMEDLFADGAYDDRFVAAYLIGWRITPEEAANYPHLRFAQGPDDTGVIVMFECEAEGTTGTLVVPEGMKTLSVNPLNWRTDGTPATADENPGACFTDYDAGITEVPGLCGAYINTARGTIIATGVTPEQYPEQLELLGKGSYHVYDYMFYFRSLQNNVALRIKTWQDAHAA